MYGEDVKNRLIQNSKDVNGCLEWHGALDKDGYGRIRVGGRKATGVHRASWAIANNKDPKGKLVCHKCDNPKCIKPEHLYLGTALDNNRDRVNRGRSNSAHGTRIKTSKLTPELVEKILIEYGKRGVSQKMVAAMFGVSQTAISLIVIGKNWKKSGNTGCKSKSRGLSADLNPNAKANFNMAKDIRALKGLKSQVEIAKSFGISQSLVSLILLNKCW
jgi:predicted transcriptional regulator